LIARIHSKIAYVTLNVCAHQLVNGKQPTLSTVCKRMDLFRRLFVGTAINYTI